MKIFLLPDGRQQFSRSSCLYMNESRRVEGEDVAVDRDTGATILVGS